MSGVSFASDKYAIALPRWKEPITAAGPENVERGGIDPEGIL